MQWVRRVLIVLAAALLCLPLACGGDDTPRRDGALTKAQYEERMQGLLAAVERTNAAAARDGDEVALRTAISNLGTAVEQLRALDPPAEIRQAHCAYTDGFEVFARARVAALRAGLRGDIEQVRRLQTEAPEPVRRQVRNARRTFSEQGYDITPQADPGG